MSIPDNQKIKNKFTQRQGQYLAYIFYYSRINKRAPAEIDIQNYFEVSSASTHQMIRGVVAKKLIKKEQGKGRSIVVLIPQDQLPSDW